MKLLLTALLCGGCILPLSTGAPLPATTVGHGKVGIAISAEAPVLDLLTNTTSSPSGVNYGAAPAAASTITVAYGLGDDTDLEVAGEGALYYFILPLPTGGSIGLRQHLSLGDAFDFALAGRVGGVASTDASTDSNGQQTQNGATAIYGAAQAILQYKTGSIRPLIALNLIPARIDRHPDNGPSFKFKGFASSVTVGAMYVTRHAQLGPYISVTNFESDKYAGGWFVSGGLVFAFRPDRNAPPPVAQGPDPYALPPPAYPYPGPPPNPYPPQNPYPYPPPNPNPNPNPYPPPSPSPSPTP